MVGIVAIHIAVTAHREYLDSGYVARNRDSFMPQNLYDQYFHHDYHVSKTATFMRELAVSGPSFFVSDHSDFPALSYAVLKLYPQGLGAELVYWDDQDLQQQIKDHIRDKTIYVVTGSPQQANVVLKRLGLEAGHLKEIRRAGFFSIYVVNPGDPGA